MTENQYLDIIDGNSQDPANKVNQEYKDRCDVDLAFDEWTPTKNHNNPVEYIKEFAVFFAERVKGGRI